MEEEEQIRFALGRQHIDLTYKVVRFDAASQTETIVVEADSHRYEWQEFEGGGWFLVDRFEPEMIPADIFFALVSHIFHAPVYRELKDTSDAEIRRKYLRAFVTRKMEGNG